MCEAGVWLSSCFSISLTVLLCAFRWLLKTFVMSSMSITSCLIRINLSSLTFLMSMAGSCWNVQYLWLTLRILCLWSRRSSSTVFRSLVIVRLSFALIKKSQSASAVHHSRCLLSHIFVEVIVLTDVYSCYVCSYFLCYSWMCVCRPVISVDGFMSLLTSQNLDVTLQQLGFST